MEPRLYVDQTTCHATVDGTDDIYLLVFRGSTEQPFHNSMSVIRPASYAGLEAGESHGHDIPLARYRDNRVYVIALLERDADNDLLDNNERLLDLVRTQAHVAWTTYLGARLLNQPRALDPSERAHAARTVAAAINGTLGLALTWPAGDDDLVQGARHVPITPGQEPVVAWIGDGGSYRLRFKVKAH